MYSVTKEIVRLVQWNNNIFIIIIFYYLSEAHHTCNDIQKKHESTTSAKPHA